MAKRPPRLDDPRWCALQTEIERRLRQTGALSLAITDLEQELSSGKLHSMRRPITTGACKRLAPAFWAKHLIDFSSGFVTIYRRTGEPRQWSVLAHRPEHRVDGHAYFVLPADVDRAPVDDAGDDELPPIKPGPKPRGDWPTLVEQWLVAVAADEPQRLQNVDALVVEANLFLHNQIGWAPSDDKVLRRRIRRLLKLVRR